MKTPFRVRQLGLAAFMKMNGCQLVKFDDGSFFFETEKTHQAWKLEYANSCCARHDSEVCELRKFLTAQK